MSKGNLSRTSGTSDPYSGCNFLVEIDGGGLIVGGFSEVSGLSIETEIETVREGGANDIEYKFPKGTKFSNLTLKHGVTDSNTLWKWYRDVTNGKIKRRNITIFLLDLLGERRLHWAFSDAYPIKWEGPSFNALSNTVAIETLVLVHHGFKRIE
ncbi:MAG: phage tail protein [Methanosarcina sp.]